MGPDSRLAGLAAWSLVHGFAGLWLGGALRLSSEDGQVNDTAGADAAFLFDPDRTGH